MRGLAFAAAVLLSIGVADAGWVIRIHDKVPMAMNWDGPRPDWQHWSYGGFRVIDRHCWFASGVDDRVHERDEEHRRDFHQWGQRMDLEFEIRTDTENVYSCRATDKSLTLSIEHRSSNGMAFPPHVYTFTATGGGLFADFHYALNGEEFARSYWDDFNLCTDITVYGPDRKDDVVTREDACAPPPPVIVHP